MLRRDAGWLRRAAATGRSDPPALSDLASRVQTHLATRGASFLADLVSALEADRSPPAETGSPLGGVAPAGPDQIEDALWELVGAGVATADGFASLRVLVSRNRGEVRSHFDRSGPSPSAAPLPKWQEAIRRVRTRDRDRPAHALRSLPTSAGRWSLLPELAPDTSGSDRHSVDADACARQLLSRYGVVFRDLLSRESSLPPWRDLLVALRRLEARGEIRGGRFVTGFVGEQFALPEALDLLRNVRAPASVAEVCRVAATDPLNLVGVLTPGPRVPAVVGNAVLYVDGQAMASLEAGEVVHRAPIPAGATIDDDLSYHPPPRPRNPPLQTALPL
jgi:ATP-dependent Lhr-like helicase